MRYCEKCGQITRNVRFCSNSCKAKGLNPRTSGRWSWCKKCGVSTRNPKFCSRECKEAAKPKQIKRKYSKREKYPCQKCGKFTVNKSFCSVACRFFNDNLHECPQCGNPTENIAFCSSQCAKEWDEKSTPTLESAGRKKYPCRKCGKLTTNEEYCGNPARCQERSQKTIPLPQEKMPRPARPEKPCELCGEATKNKRFCSKKCHSTSCLNKPIDKLCVNRRWVRRVLVAYLGGKCTRCGYSRNPFVLQFHHIDPSQKESEMSLILSDGVPDSLQEAEKCELLCPTCHMDHHGLVDPKPERAKVERGEAWSYHKAYNSDT